MTERAELLGKRVFDVLPGSPDDPHADGVRNLRSSLDRVKLTRAADAMPVQKYHLRWPVAGSRFEERFWSPVNAPVLDASGRLKYIIHRMEDVTEFVQREPVDERAEDAGRARDKFLGMVSHEMRAPLNVIIGFADLLASKTPVRPPARRREFARHVLVSARHLLALINDLLDLAKIQAGRMEIVPEAVPFAVLAGMVGKLVRPLAKKRRVVFEVSVPGDLPAVWADPVRLKQILYNLVFNGLKFTEPGGRVRLVARVEGQTLAFSVHDTGIGIAASDLPRLFTEFGQIGEASRSEVEGTGLGLAITKRLVELHGGTIDVSSTVGVGSKFTVRIPLWPHGSGGA